MLDYQKITISEQAGVGFCFQDHDQDIKKKTLELILALVLGLQEVVSCYKDW